MAIHATAVVDPAAELGDVEVGPFAVIGAGVTLEDGVRVGSHAVLQGTLSVGGGTVIHPHAVVGGDPQDLKYDGEASSLILGRDNIIREYVTLNRGTAKGGGVTRIGSGNLFMANSHVGHDCVVGDNCVLANSVALGGHVQVGDGAVLGGLAGVHQHARIGRYAMVGAGAMVSLDVPPFCMAQGDRARLFGLNVIGLRRAGMGADLLKELRAAYRELFRSSTPLRMAAERLATENPEHSEILEIVRFIEESQRGVCRASADPEGR
ncbi:MAG: acyl-ACP--UDP-N-acetylglucosamine O-acyltransferase [Myxococcota bacterium]|nr:acyl-ACP--UDP-N-acetylglucosamine O-acyltransferase [Myxococcota bacterium]